MNNITGNARSIINTLTAFKSEEECLSHSIIFEENDHFNTYEEIHYLARRRKYYKLLSELEAKLSGRDKQLYEIRDCIYQCYWNNIPFPTNFDNELTCYVVEQFLFNPHITSISEYGKLVAITLISSNNIQDFVRGLEDRFYNESDAEYYYIAGYFLGLHLPENHLRLFITEHIKQPVFLPSPREHYPFVNSKVSEELIDKDTSSIPDYLLSIYRPCYV